MRSAPLLVLAAATALSIPLQWLHNPRERTARAIDEWQQRDFKAADRDLEQALELGGENPRALFNAGTGRLGAGTPGAALPFLARAAEATKDPAAQALRPDALYNLGNAYLASGYAAAAADSYRAALRLAPDHRPAKHNLELALRELDKQPPPQQQQPQGGEGSQGQQGGGRQQPKQDGDEGEKQPQPQPQPQPGDQQQGQGQRSARLPSFQPQRDMSAEQAAFLLEAVENLEREQRRAQAAEQRRQRARTSTEKDW